MITIEVLHENKSSINVNLSNECERAPRLSMYQSTLNLSVIHVGVPSSSTHIFISPPFTHERPSSLLYETQLTVNSPLLTLLPSVGSLPQVLLYASISIQLYIQTLAELLTSHDPTSSPRAALPVQPSGYLPSSGRKRTPGQYRQRKQCADR